MISEDGKDIGLTLSIEDRRRLLTFGALVPEIYSTTLLYKNGIGHIVRLYSYVAATGRTYAWETVRENTLVLTLQCPAYKQAA